MKGGPKIEGCKIERLLYSGLCLTVLSFIEKRPLMRGRIKSFKCIHGACFENSDSDLQVIFSSLLTTFFSISLRQF